MAKDKLYDINFYNKEAKERFLENNYENLNTRKYYRSILGKVAEYEANEYEKDVFNFTLDEIKDLLSTMGSKSPTSLNSVNSVITKYIQWAIDEGLTKSNIDLTELINKKDIKKNVNKYAIKNQYLRDRFELELINNFCVNAQDSVLFYLLYDGVKGTKHEEIINLKIEDCNFDTNTLTLTRDDGTQREIEVYPETMKAISNAIEQKEYLKNNGKAMGRNESEQGLTIAYTPYIVRPSHAAGKMFTDKVAPIVVNSRIGKIVKEINRPYLNPTNIFYSGMIHRLKDIKEQRELTKEDYLVMCKRYGLNQGRWFDLKEKFEMFLKVQS